MARVAFLMLHSFKEAIWFLNLLRLLAQFWVPMDKQLPMEAFII
jgi:hypothetical protein